jgi:hypothetical protein
VARTPTVLTVVFHDIPHPSRQVIGQYLKSDKDGFPPRPFQCIIHYSSYRSMRFDLSDLLATSLNEPHKNIVFIPLK